MYGYFSETRVENCRQTVGMIVVFSANLLFEPSPKALQDAILKGLARKLLVGLTDS